MLGLWCWSFKIEKLYEAHNVRTKGEKLNERIFGYFPGVFGVLYLI